MPIDAGYDEDDLPAEGEDAGRGRRFGDFDCPDCSANNPWDDGFGDGDELRCFYCGQELRAAVTDAGRLRLKVI